MLRPSTKTRLFFGSTALTVPVLPLSLPVITLTVSPLRILRRWAMGSEHLRGQGDDLHEVAVAQLARHRAEDARAARVVGGVDDHGRVLVEGDVGAVLAAELLLGPYDHGGHDLALLDVAVRDRLLDRGDDAVADAGGAALRASADADAQDLARAGVVGHAKSCLRLDHLPTPLQDLDQPPALRPAQRPRLHHAHEVALVGVVALVVHVQLGRGSDDLLVALVAPCHVDADRDRLVRLRGDHYARADLRTAGAVLAGLGLDRSDLGGAALGALGLLLRAVGASRLRVLLAASRALGGALLDRLLVSHRRAAS